MVRQESEIKGVILKVINYLQKKIELDYVILFGSYATGQAHEFSDIDLGVISKDFENMSFEDKANLFAQVKINCDLNVEIHPFSLSDFKEARPTNFLGFILRNGKFYLKGKKLVA